MIQFLNEIDTQLFLLLNGIHNDVMDTIMFWVTKKETWYPFYLIAIILMYWKLGKKALIPLLLIIAGIAISDQLTSSFMKPFFERLRPCHNPDLQSLVHLVAGCGGKFGFASGHAANSFTLSTLLFLFFNKYIKHLGWMFLWAVIVSYSRIYVGVHYPGDVLVGGLIGILTGYLLYFLYLKLPERYRIGE